MSVDLEALRRLADERRNLRRGARWVVLGVAFAEHADAILAALERAERVKLHAGRLVERIDEFESCLQDRGITQAPCHGIPPEEASRG